MAAQIVFSKPASGYMVSNRKRAWSFAGLISPLTIWAIGMSAPLWPDRTTFPGVGAPSRQTPMSASRAKTAVM